MYVQHTKYKTMAGEPHLGYQVESELIEDKGEGLELLIDFLVDEGYMPNTFYVMDDMTEQLDIELEARDYLEAEDIEMLSEALDENIDLTKEQIYKLLKGEAL